MEPPTEQPNQNTQPNSPPQYNPAPAQTAVTPTPYVSPPPNPSQQFNPPQNTDHAVVNSPGVIVLQWLTYAFWGWTILAMSILTITVLANFITGTETGGFTPYGIAAVLVLLPISIVCDVFYSKQEPAKKAGAASIVMVIHAVIFALFGIGSVIAIVFSLVSIFTSGSDSSSMQVSLYSAMIIAVLYGAVFLRTINPPRLSVFKKFFIIFMTIVVGIIAILGIVGPAANERATRNDRLITGNINLLKTEIDDYTREKKKLPADLADLSLDGDVKNMVDKGLVRYTANTLPSTGTTRRSTTTSTTHYYQLCVTYTKASKDRYRSSSGYANDSDGYTTYISSYGAHDAGEECYKIKTNNYNYDY